MHDTHAEQALNATPNPRAFTDPGQRWQGEQAQGEHVLIGIDYALGPDRTGVAVLGDPERLRDYLRSHYPGIYKDHMIADPDTPLGEVAIAALRHLETQVLRAVHAAQDERRAMAQRGPHDARQGASEGASDA
jgi:hypothetical protein